MRVPPHVAALEDEDADNADFMNFVISLAIHGFVQTDTHAPV